MRAMGLLLSLVTMVAMAVPAIAQSFELPETGTYFITNIGTEEAMQANAPTIGQNVLMFPFNKGGLQKWAITRRLDPITNKPTNRYNIRLAGDTTGLYFQPHPAGDMTAIIGYDSSIYALEPTPSGLMVKSVQRNGDAMYVLPSPPMNAEVRFGPSDGSTKYYWKFTPAE